MQRFVERYRFATIMIVFIVSIFLGFGLASNLQVVLDFITILVACIITLLLILLISLKESS